MAAKKDSTIFIEGTIGNDNKTSTSAKEKFDLKTGEDTIVFDVSNGKTIGNDTVVFNDGEKLTIDLRGIYSHIDSFYGTKTYQYGLSVSVSGDNLVLTIPERTVYEYGKFVETTTYNKKTNTCTVTTKLYIYDYEKGEYNTKPTDVDTYSYNGYPYDGLGTKTTYARVEIGCNSGKWSGAYSGRSNVDSHATAEQIGEYAGTNKNYTESITILGAGKKLSADSMITLKITDMNGESEIAIENMLTAENVPSLKGNGLLYTVGDGRGQTGKTIKGSYLNECIYGTHGNDTIYARGGNDEIYSYGGKDKIYLGESSSTIHILDTSSNANPYTIAGGETVYEATSDDILSFSESTSYDYARNGNDLIVFNDDYEIGFGNEYIFNQRDYENMAQKVTIKDFFISEDQMNTFKYKHIQDHDKSTSDITHTFTDVDLENNTITYTENITYRDDNNELQNSTENVTINLKEFVMGKGKLNAKDENTIFISTGKSTISTGNGDDTVYLSSKNETVNIDGDGVKKISITDKIGTDTINITDSDAEININTKWMNKLFVKTNDNLDIYYFDKYGYVLGGKTVIKDYFKNPSNHNFILDKIDIEEQINSQKLNIIGNSKKANTLTGSDFNDDISGGNKADTITTGSGNDTIAAGKGNDIITIDGAGVKVIDIKHGEGKDTIKFENNSAEAQLVFDKNDQFSIEKNGNDLILYRTYESGSAIKTDSTVIENYENHKEQISLKYKSTDSEGNPILVDFGLDLDNTFEMVLGSSKTSNNIELEGKQLFIGGKKADTITVVENAVGAIYSGAGNDTITISNGADAVIHSGAGNDKIIIDSAKDVTMNFQSGGGNDTVEFTDKPTGTITMDLHHALDSFYNKNGQFNLEKYDNAFYNGIQGFTKDGNNLVYKSLTNKGKTETTTILNYFNNDGTVNANLPEIILNEHSILKGEEIFSDTETTNEISYLLINGQYNSATKKTVFEGCSFGGITTNLYNYNGNGTAEISAKDTQDSFIFGFNKNTNVYVNDAGSSEDYMLIKTDKSNLRALFNVGITKDDDGNLVSSEIKVTNDNTNSDNLFIFNKQQFTYGNVLKTLVNNTGLGVININNYFADGSTGVGKIERFDVGQNISTSLEIDVEGWIDSIKSSVATWLYNNGYSDTMAVFESENTTDINSLLKVYMSETCNYE